MLSEAQKAEMAQRYKTAKEANKGVRPILPDGGNWNKVPYQVNIGAEFKTMAEAWAYKANVHGGHMKYADPKENTSNPHDTMAVPTYIDNPYFKDTRVGASDAINCIWQFNRDDDIVHPVNKSVGDAYDIGLGRVYAATTEQNQSIAWFTFGVPRFTALVTFYKKAAQKELIALNQTGSMQDKDLGRIFGTLGMLAFEVIVWPLRTMIEFMNRLNTFPVDRFYELRSTMHLYYKYVDSILVEWLVNTGIYGVGKQDGSGTATTWAADPASLPLAMQATGPSIWNILTTRVNRPGSNPNATNPIFEKSAAALYPSNGDSPAEMFENAVSKLTKMKPTEYDESTDEDVTIWSNNFCDWGKALAKSAMGATQFVGFRIEKNVDASESFSNSTGPSEMAEKINSMSQEAASKSFDMGGTSEGGVNTGIGLVDSTLNGFKGVISGISSAFGVDGLASAVMGGAFIDIPEQYKSSDFNKSHSLSFQLRSPYGDITSIYQSIMIPLAMLLAAALPRAAGVNAYTQPFLCRVYCKGIFSVPMGIIDSLSIKRGSSEFGWTYANLPTCIDVSMSIKDLSPVMYMAIKDRVFESLWGTNNSFNEYMLTLAGTGLFERISRWAQFRRHVQYTAHKIRNQTLNPMSWMNSIGESSLAQFVASCSPWYYQPTSN